MIWGIKDPFNRMTIFDVDVEDVIGQPFGFQNKGKIILMQAFLSIYILRKSGNTGYNILNLRTS